MAYWKMDEVSGSSVVDSIGSYNGTVTGTTVVPGRLGNARSFNGTTDIVRLGITSLLSSQNLTISAWVKPTDLNGRSFIGGHNPGSNNPTSQVTSFVQLVSDGSIWFFFGDADGNQWARIRTEQNSLVNTNTWTHLVATRTGNTSGSIYVNGAAVTTTYECGSTCGSIWAGTPAYLGSHSSSPSYQGVLDEVGVWNRVLSPSEVLALFSSY